LAQGFVQVRVLCALQVSAMAGAEALEALRRFESGNDVRQIIQCSEGGRALRLLKRREDVVKKAEIAKQEIENETKKRKFATIDQKFGGSKTDQLEEEFKKQTVGLVSAEEFRARRMAIDDLIQGSMNKSKSESLMKVHRKMNTSKLSFDDDLESDEEESDEEGATASAPPKKHFGKDPTVDTSFLYDAEREVAKEIEKASLIEEYKRRQEAVKKDRLEVTYSYWDGSGHRRSCVVEKGFTIAQFLSKSKAELEKADFPELRHVSLDSIMYVKEDLIIPHAITFYELIQSRARGKSGPLFNFDVHEDIRMANDVRIEKDESHAGKIVDRKWYERNKHIFPACRWEIYSKDKTYETYTVHGDVDHSRPSV